MSKPLHRLPPIDPEGLLTVVIETPKGSRNKYAYEEDSELFVLKGVLPEGTSFPYDFGMIPSTKGGDGDPLDILIIMDAPAFPGCLITARVIGAIEAEQRERDGAWSRNDRLIGVASKARTHQDIEQLADLRTDFVAEIEAFFEHYNRLAGKEFRPTGRHDRQGAWELVHRSIQAFKQG